MSRAIRIIGAGRTGRFTLDICTELGLEVEGFIADGDVASVCGHPVLASYQSLLQNTVNTDIDYALAIGDPIEKYKLYQTLKSKNANLATIIHPNTVISPFAKIGEGVIVNAFTSILNGAVVQAGALIEDHCAIGVDVGIGCCTTVAPGVCFNANSAAGDRCFIGSGAIVNPEVTIGENCLIGSNAAVTRDIPNHRVAAGTPAKVIREMDIS